MHRCYWCGKAIKEGEKVYSLSIFNPKKRSFCSRKCRRQYRARKRRERRTLSSEKKRQRMMIWAMLLFYALLTYLILYVLRSR